MQIVYFLCFVGGWAGLTWELLWFHHASFAIGASAKASALVLVSVMIGMTIGSIFAGQTYARWRNFHPLKSYAFLEMLIGVCGALTVFGFRVLRHIDKVCYQLLPQMVMPLDFAGIILILILPTIAMGATIAVFARISDYYNISISKLYAANIAGATFGVLTASFLLIPSFGIQMTTGISSCLNIFIALALFLFTMTKRKPASCRTFKFKAIEETIPKFSQLAVACLVTFCTGFATFNLEVSWFRSFRAAFQSTTESFAIMLSAVLMGLAFGASISSKMRASKKISLGNVLLLSAFFVFISTPLIERVDLSIPILMKIIPTIKETNYVLFTIYRSILSILLMSIPSAFIGIALPWIIDEHNHSRSVAVLYAINTIGAVTGSIFTSWFLLPIIGFAKSAWIAGLILALPVMFLKKKGKRTIWALFFIGLFVTIYFESSVGRIRVQQTCGDQLKGYKVVAYQEGPDSSVSVVERPSGTRDLIIDGFLASSDIIGFEYMIWMGRLPMIFHKNPKHALVICFGTGRTADAVRQEGPQTLDVVDISPAVFNMAPYFKETNKNILNDERVTSTVMDGRLWLQRVEKIYDIITLEPMPPTFAGVNSLYSKEFYTLCASKLADDGLMAQWLPFHLVSSFESASIIKTFTFVFPNTILWVHPDGTTGILLGKNTVASSPVETWELYGLKRYSEVRSLGEEEIKRAIAFDAYSIYPFSKTGSVITDDNQYLSYGYGRSQFNFIDMRRLNFLVIQNLTGVPNSSFGVHY